MRRPRILYFSPVHHFKGGAERSLMDLVANPAVEPHVLVPRLGPISEKMHALGIPTSVIDFGDIENVRRPFNVRKGLAAARSTASAVRTLLRICKAHRIDIVHSNGLKPHVISALARRAGGPAAVAHIRDIPFTRAERAVWQLLRRSADRLILVSRACWPGMELPRNAVVVYNGVDVACITPRAYRPASPLRLGFIGRIDAAKGLHLLVDWIENAKKADADLRLVVRGRFDSSDSAYQDQIEAQTRRLGLRDQIEFQGFVANPEDVYAGIDVVCVPSHVPDPLPRAVMEPMARGIPVIGYPAGGILDMIEHRRTGFLASNAAEFLEAIEWVRSPGPLIDEVLANARSRIENTFSLQSAYRILAQIYDDLAHRPYTH
jgi:glycosyltransferase involved in cell wall biosynthesis